MALDEALAAAIQVAVARQSQPKTVATRLIAWLESLAVAEEPIDKQAQFYASLIDAIVVGGNDENQS